ncbi:MAG: hypothetical protein N3I86_14680, partial [Verrucomicrobiae bacterium]|nr:hypothetical protein [Verrucomicrobiae bacterium]
MRLRDHGAANDTQPTSNIESHAGSARVARAVFGVPPKTFFRTALSAEGATTTVAQGNALGWR